MFNSGTGNKSAGDPPKSLKVDKTLRRRMPGPGEHRCLFGSRPIRGESPAEGGGREREGSGKTKGLKSALRDTKFVVFCETRSAPSVPEPESELLSLLDS